MGAQSVRACLITNPRSGRGGIDLSNVLPVLEAHGWETVVRQKRDDGDATKLAREAAHDGCDVVVACGGDGTLSEVVDGLVGTDVAVGDLPGGTANVWAHEIGIAPRLDLAALQLVGAQRRRVDVGHAAINGAHGQHFLLMAGLGIDGAVMARVSRSLENRIGPLAVGVAALQALPACHAVPVEVELDGVRWRGRLVQAVIGNTRRYAGFTRVTPGAYADDGRLDVCLFPASGPVAAGRQLAALLVRRRPSRAGVVSDRAARVTVTAPVVLPLQLDGSVITQGKVKATAEGVVYTFSVVAQGLTVLVPRTYDGELFEAGAAAPPPLRLHAAAGEDKANGAGKLGKRPLRVVAVGVDAITAVHLEDGHVVTVAVDHATRAEDATGSEQPLAAFLDGLGEGDLLRVKGKADHDSGTILARRIVRLEPAAGTS